MKVKVAETAGFCFGVKRAVDKVYQLIEEGTHPIYTLGPIIHNEEVVTDLAAKGVQVIEEKDLASLTEGTVVIRSHGVGEGNLSGIKRESSELCRCHLSFRAENTPHCRKTESCRKTRCYFWRS